MNENQIRVRFVGASFFLILASANTVFAAEGTTARQIPDPDKLNVNLGNGKFDDITTPTGYA